jgi:protein arginine N-methyltransferase 1
MPPKQAARMGSAARAAASLPAARQAPCRELNESLLLTDEEKLATSKSLYGDHKARVSANTHHIHDRMRIRAYTTAMQAAYRGKRVLHLGCGMGLLSMLAAKAGAASVVAVDTSTIVQSAKVVAAQNELSNVTFLHGSLHEGTVQLPAEHKEFDVILCEWMSSFVTNDSTTMRELLYCRDNFLVKGGIVCPNEASLSVVGITDYQYKCDTVDYWDNVYGFNMAPMKQLVMREPTGCSLPKHLVKTKMATVATIKAAEIQSPEGGVDLKDKSKNANLVFEGDFSLPVTAKTTLHFLTFYASAAHRDATTPAANFDLASTVGGHNPWTEVSAALPEALPVFPGDLVTGHVRIEPKGNDTEITLTVSCKNSLVDHNSTTVHHFQY